MLLDALLPAAVFAILWTVANGGVAYAVATLVGLAYFTVLEGGPGQTIGKRVVGVRVVRAEGEGPVGYGAAAVRYVSRYVSAAPCLLGYLWALWDGRRQTWHDKIADTLVVPAS
jgi:uncharacterized RDD family membrane protein YckC